jgi:hypothetical protein
MKTILKNDVAVQISEYIYLECTVVSHRKEGEQIIYSVAFNKDVFEATDEFVVSIDEFYEVEI